MRQITKLNYYGDFSERWGGGEIEKCSAPSAAKVRAGEKSLEPLRKIEEADMQWKFEQRLTAI